MSSRAFSASPAPSSRSSVLSAAWMMALESLSFMVCIGCLKAFPMALAPLETSFLKPVNFFCVKLMAPETPVWKLLASDWPSLMPAAIVFLKAAPKLSACAPIFRNLSPMSSPASSNRSPMFCAAEPTSRAAEVPAAPMLLIAWLQFCAPICARSVASSMLPRPCSSCSTAFTASSELKFIPYVSSLASAKIPPPYTTK